MSVQYTAIFHGCKNDNFQIIFFYIFLIFAQNIDCGHTLEPPQRGPSKPHFFYIKVGCKGVFVTRTCFRDVVGKIDNIAAWCTNNGANGSTFSTVDIGIPSVPVLKPRTHAMLVSNQNKTFISFKRKENIHKSEDGPDCTVSQ